MSGKKDMPPMGDGKPEKLDPNKTVFGTPDGRLSNQPIPGMYKRGETKEPTPVSAVSLMHERGKELAQEAKTFRLSLQKGAKQEAIGHVRMGGETSDEVLARVEQLRASRMLRMQAAERSVIAIRTGLDAVATDSRPTDDFLHELDQVEEDAASHLDSLWKHREAHPGAYAEAQARLKSLMMFKEQVRTLKANKE